MPENQVILYEVADAVAAITLNRPDRLNAITDELFAELLKALKQAAKDSAVRAVLLTGAGRAFCAGQDLQAFQGERPDNHVYHHLMTSYRPVIKQLRAIEKPVIAAINGVAAGAGASLALACDLRIMSSQAFLLQAFSNIALIPDAGSTWFFVRQVGYSRAFELAIEGERIPAERCLELGLANRLAEPDALMDDARAWAVKLAQRPTLALGLTKRAMNRALTATLLETLEYEAHLQQLASGSSDFVEGVAAFIEKRPPVFTGS
ncbi:MAG: enoyl-CoA hydratase-related protein [Anaerolineae bacterium]